MFTVLGIVLVAIGLCAEFASLFCLYRMWTRGRLLEHAKYEVIDGLLHYPKFFALPVGCAAIVTAQSGLHFVMAMALFFAVLIAVFCCWAVLSLFATSLVAKHYSALTSPSTHVHGDGSDEPPPPQKTVAPTRQKARVVYFGKDHHKK